MQAILMLEAATNGKVITLTAKHSGYILMLGSSCPASLLPKERGGSLSISPEQEGDIIAIEVSHLETRGKDRHWITNCYILVVTKDDQDYRIELGKQFIPQADRLGQIVKDAGLVGRSGGESFLAPVLLSGYKDEEKLAELSKTYRILPLSEGNLICRFLVNKTPVENLQKAAASLVTEKVDVPALKQELKSVQDAYMNNLKTLNEKEEQFKAYCKDLENDRTHTQAQLVHDLRKIDALKKSVEDIVAETRRILNSSNLSASWFGAKNQKLDMIAELMDQIEAQMKKPA